MSFCVNMKPKREREREKENMHVLVRPNAEVCMRTNESCMRNDLSKSVKLNNHMFSKHWIVKKNILYSPSLYVSWKLEKIGMKSDKISSNIEYCCYDLKNWIFIDAFQITSFYSSGGTDNGFILSRVWVKYISYHLKVRDTYTSALPACKYQYYKLYNVCMCVVVLLIRSSNEMNPSVRWSISFWLLSE